MRLLVTAVALLLLAPAAAFTATGGLKLCAAWLPTKLAFAVDHDHEMGVSAPMTRYFFHPTTSALDQLKLELDAKSWLSGTTRDRLIAEATALIEAWDSHRKDAPTDAFPSVTFLPVVGELQVDTPASNVLTDSQRRRLAPTKPLVRVRASRRIREDEDDDEEQG